jgi:hypothetical protein
MIALIIQYLVAGACLLFVVSLPLGKTGAGASLRRGAAVLFLLAFMPSVFFGLISSGSASPNEPRSAADQFGCAIAGVLTLATASVVAYAFLEIRKRIKRPSKDAWSEYINLRSTGKTTVRRQTSRRRHTSPLMEDDDDE